MLIRSHVGRLLYQLVIPRNKINFHSYLYEKVEDNYFNIFISDSIIECLKAVSINIMYFSSSQYCVLYNKSYKLLEFNVSASHCITKGANRGKIKS